MAWHPAPCPGASLYVFGSFDSADLAEGSEDALPPIRHQDVDVDLVATTGLVHRRQQLRKAGALGGRDRDGTRVAARKRADGPAPRRGAEEVDFVERHHPGLVGGAEVSEDLLDCFRLLIGSPRAGVEHLAE